MQEGETREQINVISFMMEDFVDLEGTLTSSKHNDVYYTPINRCQGSGNINQTGNGIVFTGSTGSMRLS